MFEPNQYTSRDKSGAVHGLHKFKDGALYLAMQHKSGDWFTVRQAKDADVAYFEKHGVKAIPKPNTPEEPVLIDSK